MHEDGPYVCVEIAAAGDVLADVLAGILWDAEPLGILEEPCDAGTLLRAFFVPGTDASGLEADLASATGGAAAPRVLVIPKEDWFRRFRESFQPFRPLPDVSVRPPWAPRSTARTEIVIDPGAAFGTGLHESTRAAMTLLDSVPLQGRSMVDVGAGSGILSFFAARRGARVVALEIDLDAIGNLRENRESNALRREVAIVAGGPGSLRSRFDVLACNLTHEILDLHADQIAALARPFATVVLAGLLVSRRDAALALARRFGARPRELCLGDWLALAVTAHATDGAPAA